MAVEPVTLSIPVVSTDDDLLSAALKYAAAGWYVLPVSPRDRKNPGSVLGKGWQHRSSRDTEQIVEWFSATPYLLALHVGRSGGWVADVDHPDEVPQILGDAIERDYPPHQSSRPDQLGRGHFVFEQPPGRMIGNSTGKLGKAWGEGRGKNGIIMVCPSAHAAEKDGALYEWLETGAVPVLPPELAELLPDATDATDAATDADLDRFVAAHTAAAKPGFVKGPLSKFDAAHKAGTSRHDALIDAACWAAREAMVGLFPAAEAFHILRAAFVTAAASSRDGKERVLSQSRARAEANAAIAWAVAQARHEGVAAILERVRKRLPDYSPPPAASDTPPADLLDGLLEQLRTWQDLPDTSHIYAALAVAATAEAAGEPAWLLLVAAPSSGKTETVRILDGSAAAHLDEVTVAGLLSWTKRGKIPKPTGVLTRVTRGLITFGDLSTLLATSDKGGRDQVFAILRRVYDGELVRDVGAPSGAGTDGPLSWTGRLTVVGAVTGAIDHYSAHADALGARWLYCRLVDRDTAAKRRAAGLARHGGLAEHRQAARDLAGQIIVTAAAKLPEKVPDAILDAIEDAALVCCWGRASVPRHGYGAREIDGPVTIEEPMRVVHQLGTVARGLLALGCTERHTSQLCRRLALDSMPASRRAVLAALTRTGDSAAPTTSQVATAGGLDRKVTHRVLEDLEAIGVVTSYREGVEPAPNEPDKRYCFWQFAGQDGQLIGQVIREHDLGCSEKGEPYTQPPKKEGSEDDEHTRGPLFSEHPQAAA